MGHTVGHYTMGGHDSHIGPPLENPGAIGREEVDIPTGVDKLLEQDEGRVRVAQSLEDGVQILPPDLLKLCYLGIRVMKDFPDAYQQYLAIIEGYRNAGLIDQKVVDSITYMLEKNYKEPLQYKPEVGFIGAMTESPPRLQNQY